MLTIRFFSSIREALDTSEMTMPFSEDCRTVAALKARLASGQPERWHDALFQPNVVHAVNQRVVAPDHSIQAGDEIAFFPPMTGG